MTYAECEQQYDLSKIENAVFYIPKNDYEDLVTEYLQEIILHYDSSNEGYIKYICEKLGIEMPDTPKDFLESISFANFGKFSIQTDSNNKDYAGKKDKLDCSMPYIKVDLELLRPDVIVIFNSIYRKEKQSINEIKGNAQIIRICQINAGTVNRLISKKNSYKDVNELSPVIKEWYDFAHFNQNGFSGKTHQNFLSVFTYLDNILKQK